MASESTKADFVNGLLRRMRWLGLAKAGLQARLTTIAYNLRRTVTLLHAA